MFGYSVYVSDYVLNGLPPIKKDDLVFTSLHIKEEFDENYKENALNLLKILKEKDVKTIVDIDPSVFEFLGVKDLKELKDKYGISILRLDFGFEKEEIIEASKIVDVAVNASTSDYELAEKILNNNHKIYTFHNYYPRKESGLDEDFFEERNKELREKGFRIIAFISGDLRKRGPLYFGLPTLESHRYLKPYIQYLELKKKFKVEDILVGDPMLSDKQRLLIEEYEKDGVINLPCTLSKEYEHLYNEVLTIRSDSPNDNARIVEGKKYKKGIIEPKNTIERKKGSITVDNKNYLRYEGEIQIIKKDFKQDDFVNVIGNVDPDYERILPLINRGDKVRFIKN